MSVIAWRCWRTERRGGGVFGDHKVTWSDLPPNLMYSIHFPFTWTGPSAKSELIPYSGVFIDYKGLHSLKKEFLHPLFLGNSPTRDFVVGKVEITGQTVEHKGGWLSERQTVVELHVPSIEYVKRYEELFQCDVYLLDDIWDFFLNDDEAYKLRNAQSEEEGNRLGLSCCPIWAQKGYRDEYWQTPS